MTANQKTKSSSTNSLLWVAAYTAICAIFTQYKMFESPLFLVVFIILGLIFISPVSPMTLVPEGSGSSAMTIPKRKSKFIEIDVVEAPCVGSKPMNFWFAPMYLEYKIVASPLGAFFKFIGWTPNMVTIANLVYRFFVIAHLALYPGNMWVNFGLLMVSQVLDAVDGLMARKYKMGSELGAILDITCDDIFGVMVVTLLVSFVYRDVTLLLLILLFGVVLIPMGNEAYSKSMKHNDGKKSIGVGGKRHMNFFEFFGCFCEEFMSLILLLVAWMLSYAHQNNFFIQENSQQLPFEEGLKQNVSQVMDFVVREVAPVGMQIFMNSSLVAMKFANSGYSTRLNEVNAIAQNSTHVVGF